MYIKKVKRKCGVRGCKNTDSFAVSRTREVGNSVIICPECLKNALEAVGEYVPEPPKGHTPPPPLFYNAAAKGELPSDTQGNTNATDETKKRAETAPKIQIRRGSKADIPSLEQGEPANAVEQVIKTTADGEFICEICGKPCKTKAALTKHMTTHKESE